VVQYTYLYMKRLFSYTTALLLLPFLTHAQAATSTPTSGLQLFFRNLLNFINTAIIPFILGIAFLFLAINVVRYFIIGAGNEDSREKAKSLALYGVLAFVVIIVFWGVVNLFSSSIGLGGQTAPTVDYVQINTP
jgi:succinate dehydrogenase/fumarate reductase cytochrome b subunit